MQGCHKHSVCKNAIPGKYNKVKDNNIRLPRRRECEGGMNWEFVVSRCEAL